MTYQLVASKTFLTGNISDRLTKTEQAITIDESFKHEQRALVEVIPDIIPIEIIDITPGMTWFCSSSEELCRFYEQFVKETFNETVKFFYSKSVNTWDISATFSKDNESYENKTWGWGFDHPDKVKSIPAVGQKMADGLFTMLMDFKTPTANKKVGDSWVKDDKMTSEAIQRQEQIRNEFSRWCKTNHKDRLEAIYNQKFNNYVLPNWDGTGHFIKPFLKRAGMAQSWIDKIRPYQLDAIWRMASSGTNQLLALEVGLGKTIVMIAAFALRQQFKTAKKAAFVVQKSTIRQFAAVFKEAFPNKKVLVTSVEELSQDNRQMFLATAAYWDWDVVLMTHEQFRAIPITAETEGDHVERVLEMILEELENVTEDEEENGKRRGKKRGNRVVKRLETERDELQFRLDLLNERRDVGLHWEDLGFDLICYDEAQTLKRDRIITKLNVTGLPTGTSQRAEDFSLKLSYLEERYGDGYLWCSTGTPEPTNSLVGLYIFQRYLQPRRLREANMSHFDCWIKNFGRIVTSYEFKISGHVSETDRLKEWVNLPELLKMWLAVVHIKRYQDVSGQGNFERPDYSLKKVESKITDFQLGMMNVLWNRYDAIANFEPWKFYARDTDGCLLHVPKANDDDRNDYGVIRDSKPIRIMESDGAPVRDYERALKLGLQPAIVVDCFFKVYSDAKKLMLHEGLPVSQDWHNTGIGGEIRPLPQYSKIHQAVRRIYRWWKLTREEKLTQLVFLDTGTPGGSSRICLYDLIRDLLVDMGMPYQQIAFIHDYKTDEAKEKLFDDFNAGEISVLIGSTSPLGIGVNVQERVKVLHMIDITQRPDQFEQRCGRAIRSGNKNKKVLIYQYMTSGKPGANYGADACMFELLEAKIKSRERILRGDPSVRRIVEDGDQQSAFMMLKAHASGDRRYIKRMEIATEIEKEENHKNLIIREISTLRSKQRNVTSIYAAEQRLEEAIKEYNSCAIDASIVQEKLPKVLSKNKFVFKWGDETYIGVDLRTIEPTVSEKINVHPKVALFLWCGLSNIPWTPIGITAAKQLLGELFEKDLATLQLKAFETKEYQTRKLGEFAGLEIHGAARIIEGRKEELEYVTTRTYLAGDSTYGFNDGKTVVVSNLINKVYNITDNLKWRQANIDACKLLIQKLENTLITKQEELKQIDETLNQLKLNLCELSYE